MICDDEHKSITTTMRACLIVRDMGRERFCRQAAEDIIAYSALATAYVELFRNCR